jgi:hypothetical protein
MPDHRNANRFTCLGNGKFDDLYLNPLHALILRKERIGDVIRDRFDQHIMLSGWKVGRGMLQIHIIFGLSKRGVRRKMLWTIKINPKRYPQRLRKMGFFGINACQDMDLQVTDFEGKAVFFILHDAGHRPKSTG